MVFCGKPSGGCHACRERKTRCDQVPEGCTQCKRAKRQCPGYRLQGDMIFRDNTSSVIRKAKAKAKGKDAKEPQQMSVSSPARSDTSLEIVRQEEKPSSVYSLVPTLEDRATGFFVANYVVGVNGPSRGYMAYLADISRTQILDEGLECGIRAVGLASYAHAAHAPSLMKNARYQYVRALQATNRSLRDPATVKKDTTLLSVMVLGIFETVTGSNRFSLRHWVEHLSGASAIVKLRGPEQVKSVAGRQMFLQLATTLMVSNIQRSVPAQKHIQEYVDLAYRFVEKPEPPFIVLHTMMRLTVLRAAVAQKKIKDGQDIITQALELDGILLEVATTLPPGWEYQIVTTDVESPCIFRGRYHIYYDFWMSQIWNALRTLRVFLNEMIRNVLLEGFKSSPPRFRQAEYTAQFQISTDVLYECQFDILCSVPQHLGFPFLDPPASPGSSNFEVSPFGRIPVTGAWFLVFPLWLAGLMDIATEEVRIFVINNLRYVADTTGISQASVLADIVAQKDFDATNEVIWKGFDDGVTALAEGPPMGD